MTKTNRNGYKLFSKGHAYTKERGPNTKGNVTWRCEWLCGGRGFSVGFEPPFIMTGMHQNHKPDMKRIQVLQSNETIKKRAKESKDKPRTIVTETNKEIDLDAKPGFGKEFEDLSKIVVIDELSVTCRRDRFFWDDSGTDDPERILIFTTKENLKLLDRNPNWFCDRTFDISPTLFTQLYTIHVKISILIMKKRCSMQYINNLFKRVQDRHLNDFYSDESFRESFKMVQALAFVPVNDVVQAYKIIEGQSNEKFKLILSYFEKCYIGRLKENSKSIRVVPRFPIPSWNLHERILSNLPRTTNSVEAWQSAITNDEKSHLKFNQLIDKLKTEQSHTENNLVKIKAGEIVEKPVEQKKTSCLAV
ncbi:hypothetical protein BpHYR1_051270 [Brachionus plicatilis]|uniref:Uncharacterized protein n=1 Tax=Brachionus plicatilis TaxID=10195 RepID=A0A3M7T8R7_BRAPC|nr:hypothetical protein BpHYR1_051270 [Brachionus plicatilis]